MTRCWIIVLRNNKTDDWARYGDNIALEDVGSDAWHEWIAKNWDVEIYKRRMNYTLPYYKTEGNIRWFINTDWVFDRRKYGLKCDEL